MSVEQMAFDAKALSETKRQVSWLSPSLRRLLRPCFGPMAYRRGIFFCDLQLRDSSRFTRDSLLVNTAYIKRSDIQPNCLFFQRAGALARTRHRRSPNAPAKIQKLFKMAKNRNFNFILTQGDS